MHLYLCGGLLFLRIWRIVWSLYSRHDAMHWELLQKSGDDIHEESKIFPLKEVYTPSLTCFSEEMEIRGDLLLVFQILTNYVNAKDFFKLPLLGGLREYRSKILQCSARIQCGRNWFLMRVVLPWNLLAVTVNDSRKNWFLSGHPYFWT